MSSGRSSEARRAKLAPSSMMMSGEGRKSALSLNMSRTARVTVSTSTLSPHQLLEGEDFVDGALDLPHVGGDVLRDILEHRVGQVHAAPDGLVF